MRSCGRNRISLDSAKVNRVLRELVADVTSTLDAPELDNVSISFNVAFQDDVPGVLGTEAEVAAAVCRRLSQIFAACADGAGGVLAKV